MYRMQHNGVHITLGELLALRPAGLRVLSDNRRPVQSAMPGAVRSPARGSGIEFVEVRPYQAGDDIRSIDWRVSARTGKPFTKLYAEERERPVYIAVDQRVNMYFGSGAVFKSVFAARLAALIGWSALAEGNRVGGVVMSESLQRVRSAGTRKSFVQLLQSVVKANSSLHAQSQHSAGINKLLKECLLNTSTGTTVSIISDFHDVGSESLQSLTALGRNRKLVLLKINDPLEMTLEAVGSVGISDGLETARVLVSRRQQRSFNHSQALLVKQFVDCAAQCSAKLMSISTNDDVTDVMNRYAKAG